MIAVTFATASAERENANANQSTHDQQKPEAFDDGKDHKCRFTSHTTTDDSLHMPVRIRSPNGRQSHLKWPTIGPFLDPFHRFSHSMFETLGRLR
jgi:hypothetical protein